MKSVKKNWHLFVPTPFNSGVKKKEGEKKTGVYRPIGKEVRKKREQVKKNKGSDLATRIEGEKC